MLEEPGNWLNALRNIEPEWMRAYVNANVMTGWLVAILLFLFLWLSVRDLKLVPEGRRQTVVEAIWDWITNFSVDVIGPGGDRFAPYLATLFLYILCMNLFGIIPGFLSPTSSLNMTAALALVTFIAVQYLGFKVQGIKYFKHFVELDMPWWLLPVMIPLMLIIHVIGELARPLSLCIRLFGNIFGEDMLIAQLTAISVTIMGAIYLPVPLQFPMVVFHILISIIQALVFTMLAASYIAGAVEVHEEAHEKQAQGA